MRRRRLHLALLVILAGTVLAGGIVWSNAFGAGDRVDRLLARIERFIAGPPPDRATLPTVRVTPPPAAAGSFSPSLAPSPHSTSGPASPRPTVEPSPTPARAPVDLDIVSDPEAVFASELRTDWCAVAGVQMVLAVLGHADTSASFQRELAGRVREWESWQDSHNGEWGPAAMAEALAAYGLPGYEIRAYAARADALRDAAAAIVATGAPAILLTWRGAHAWVMTGFRADADPSVFTDATVSGGYILDPWYPRISTIWGPSDPPGTFQDAAEMRRNYLPWKRPEGRYPDRDGLFIALVPTVPVPGWTREPQSTAP